VETFPDPKLYVPTSLGPEQIVTRKSLLAQLRAAGLGAGQTVCVHAACSKIGYVVGGPRMVLDALLDSLSPDGTLMMPAFSGDLSDPSEWLYPSIPQELIEDARQSLAGYDPLLTPTKSMGSLSELLRHRPGAVRSPHPQSSFTALGSRAEELCGRHPLDHRFGPDSPLGALIRLQGKVLLLGAPWNTVSLFYLTEFSMPVPRTCRKSAPVVRANQTVWVSYEDLVYHNEWHEAVIHLLETGIAARHRIGHADSVLFDAGAATEEVIKWRLQKC
jgi:aminoglycoside 3-N-acetyltransferase